MYINNLTSYVFVLFHNSKSYGLNMQVQETVMDSPINKVSKIFKKKMEKNIIFFFFSEKLPIIFSFNEN